MILDGKNLSQTLLQLYDIQGKLVASKWLQKDKEILDLAALKSRVYVVQLTNQQGIWSRKVLKQLVIYVLNTILESIL